MDDFTAGREGEELPTRREFGRQLTRATVLPFALSLLHGAAAPAAADRPSEYVPSASEYVPEDTYPYFTDGDPTR
jgi:hypothetical protein